MTGGPPAAFDPVRLGRHESDAWVGYYQRDWPLVLRSVLGMVRSGFGLGPVTSVRSAWSVLRANQAWAPYPDNDVPSAVAHMERFYARVARAHGLAFDPRRAALLEVDWWREHRFVQRGGMLGQPDLEPLVGALGRLYAYVYAVPERAVTAAAQLRAEAMQVSDDWVGRGCPMDDPALRHERRLLVASYTALRQAVERARGGEPVRGGS
jgi:hypothetical protein